MFLVMLGLSLGFVLFGTRNISAEKIAFFTSGDGNEDSTVLMAQAYPNSTFVGKAIGFLFIPIFKVYWIFRSWGGFSNEYNRYVDRYELPVPHLAGGVFVAYPVLLLVAAILYVPLLALPFVFIRVIAKTCDAVNALGAAVGERCSQLMRSPMPNQTPSSRIYEQSAARG